MKHRNIKLNHDPTANTVIKKRENEGKNLQNTITT